MNQVEIDNLMAECQAFMNRMRERYEITSIVLLAEFQSEHPGSSTIQFFEGSAMSSYALCRMFALEHETIWQKQSIEEMEDDC